MINLKDKTFKESVDTCGKFSQDGRDLKIHDMVSCIINYKSSTSKEDKLFFLISLILSSLEVVKKEGLFDIYDEAITVVAKGRPSLMDVGDCEIKSHSVDQYERAVGELRKLVEGESSQMSLFDSFPEFDHGQ